MLHHIAMRIEIYLWTWKIKKKFNLSKTLISIRINEFFAILALDPNYANFSLIFPSSIFRSNTSMIFFRLLYEFHVYYWFHCVKYDITWIYPPTEGFYFIEKRKCVLFLLSIWYAALLFEFQCQTENHWTMITNKNGMFLEHWKWCYRCENNIRMYRRACTCTSKKRGSMGER